MRVIQHLLLIGVLIGSTNTIWAQFDRRIGDWRSYLSHNKATKSIEKAGVIYTITTGGMFSWEDATEETRSFSTVEGLSGINPTTIYVDKSSGQIFIGYADGMIDYFSDPREIRQLADIKRNTFFTQKQIYQFDSNGKRLYVATDFGLVIYDLGTRLPAFTITQIGDNPASPFSEYL